ncbi:MAG: hypothetical protein LC772_02175 [Chloroflexi bacterium]|nr:hypothetical protein [Chloroflexota bacterium]
MSYTFHPPGAATMNSNGPNATIGVGAPSFSYYVRRRDGERPLAICSLVVSLMTLGLAVHAIAHGHDWRPVAFYGIFWAASLAAAVLLGMQWRNDELVGGPEGLTHFDWRRRRREYGWGEVSRAVVQDRTENRRFTLYIGDSRSFVLHADYPGYQSAVEVCAEGLATRGIPIESR